MDHDNGFSPGEALAAAEVGMWSWAADSGAMRWSETLEALYGLTPGSFPGTFKAFRERLFDDDRDRVLQTARKSMQDGSRFHIEHRIRWPDGTLRWLEARGEPYRDAKGLLAGMRGISVDITERRQAQEDVERLYGDLRRQAAELEAIFQLVPVGVGIAADAKCRHIRANPAMAHMLGIPENANASITAPAGERPPFQVLINGDAARGEDLPMQRAAVQGVAVGETELEIQHDDGRVMYLMTQAAPLWDANQRPAGSVASFWDVTGRKRDEILLTRRMRQQEALVQLSQRALGDMDGAGLLHDAARLLCRILETDYCAVLQRQQGGSLRLCGGTGWSDGELGQASESAASDTWAGMLLQQEEPVAVSDFSHETRFRPLGLVGRYSIAGAVGMAIQGSEDPYGILAAFTREPREFTREDCNFLESVANILAMGLQRREREYTILELSTPVLEIAVGALLVPVVGRLDTRRADQLENSLLYSIRERRVRVVVIDLTGTSHFDARIAARFSRTIKAAQLLGAQVLVSGISTALAETLCGLGADGRALHAVGDLRSGIEAAVGTLRGRGVTET